MKDIEKLKLVNVNMRLKARQEELNAINLVDAFKNRGIDLTGENQGF